MLPNEDQVLGFTGEEDVVAGAKKLLAAGAGLVAVTRGGDGALLVTPEGSEKVPAFAIDVVDTTGCGDAFSAASYAAWAWAAGRTTPPSSAAPRRPWWPRDSAATTETSTSPARMRSRRGASHAADLPGNEATGLQPRGVS